MTELFEEYKGQLTLDFENAFASLKLRIDGLLHKHKQATGKKKDEYYRQLQKLQEQLLKITTE